MNRDENQNEKCVQALKEMLTPKKSTKFPKLPKNFQKLTMFYLCTAKDVAVEKDCENFLPGTNGECCYKTLQGDIAFCNQEKSRKSRKVKEVKEV